MSNCDSKPWQGDLQKMFRNSATLIVQYSGPRPPHDWQVFQGQLLEPAISGKTNTHTMIPPILVNFSGLTNSSRWRVFKSRLRAADSQLSIFLATTGPPDSLLRCWRLVFCISTFSSAMTIIILLFWVFFFLQWAILEPPFPRPQRWGFQISLKSLSLF